MRAFVILSYLWVLGVWYARGEALSNREHAFIGYSERAVECQDRLDNCKLKALNDGCLKDPYNMRTFCPVACAVPKCNARGSLKVRYKGHATPKDTDMFAKRWSALQNGPSPSNFQVHKFLDSTLHLSSLGVGTYLGSPDSRTDEAVTAAIIHSVVAGWNVIDTASNYRDGHAEVAVGAALDALLAGAVTGDFLQESTYQSDITRSMLFISSKVGFVDEELAGRLRQSKRLSHSDVTGGHTMSPAYIAAAVNTSLQRMNLQTMDLLYLHNAAEMQLRSLGWEAFRVKLKEAFRALESLRSAGLIRYYGLATWDCFRVPPEDPGHVSLQEVAALAREAAGNATSGFAAVQLPVSASMPEAWSKSWQSLTGSPRGSGGAGGSGARSVTMMEAAKELEVAVFTSGPLGEGKLVGRLTSRLDHIVQLRAQPSTPAKLLQLARSTPGAAMVTTLVGHKTREYVMANTQLARQPLLQETDFQDAMAQVEAVLAS